MPRELGKAKRADITGRFPGEGVEFGSSFVRFLEESGQLARVPDSESNEDPAHGDNGRPTEIPGAPTPGSETDTEIGLAGDGQAGPGGHGTLFSDPFGDDAIAPEPWESAEEIRPASEGELQPVEWGPSADTLHPHEPRALDSIPDLTSPELDDVQDESEVLDETDKLPPRPSRGTLPVFKPEPHEISARYAESDDTGLLEPAHGAPDRFDMAELDPEGEEDTGITIEPELSVDDRITSKVEPPRNAGRHGADVAMRDTVNFYNQTQNVNRQGEARAGEEPTLDPSGERDTRPLVRIEHGDREDEKITRPLKTVPETDEAAQGRDTQKFHEMDRPQRPEPGPAPLEPVRDGTVEDESETHRFHVAEVLSSEPTPATGDTTSDLRPAHTGLPHIAQSGGDSTLPDMATEPGRPVDVEADTARLPEPAQVDADFVAPSDGAPSERIIPEYASLEPVDDDAEEATDSNRITTRVDSSPLLGRDTDRPVASSARADQTPVVPIPAALSGGSRSRARNLTESLARRLREERIETRHMIEQAEAVVLKLREAAEQSRNDLVALSERRAALVGGGNGHAGHGSAREEQRAGPRESEGGTTLYDPPVKDESVGAGAKRRPEDPEPPARRRRDRVSTRAISDIVRELERASREPASLSALLDGVSSRGEVPGKRRRDRRRRDDDTDLLLAASDRLRATLKRELEVESGDPAPRHNGRRGDEPREPRAAHGNGHSSRREPLSDDLDRLWRVLDARRMPAVVLPPSERAKPVQRDDEPEGWTQEALWGTLVGIAGVTFILGGLFVWILFKLLS